MKTIKLIFYAIAGLFLVLLDVAFFSSFEIGGASIISSFLALIIMAISDRRRDFAYFSLILVIYFAVLSSLPMILVALNIVALPLAANLIVNKYFRNPGSIAVLIYLLLANFLFEFFFLVWTREWNVQGFMAVISFVIVNTIAGIIMNFSYNRIRRNLLADFEIKI